MLKMGQLHNYTELTDISPYHAYVSTPSWARLITLPTLPEDVNPKRAKAIRDLVAAIGGFIWMKVSKRSSNRV